MGKKFRNFILVSFIFSAYCMIGTGCTQVTPELTDASYSVIFEYQDENSLPDSRLSFFMESQTEVARYDRIKVHAIENDYIWDFNEISKISFSDKEWAGNTNLVVPENEMIPTGNYEITFFNADEKESTVLISVSYDSSIYDLNAEDLENKMLSSRAVKKIAIYDDGNILIYYGDKLSEFGTPRGIWNMYRTASYYYDVWCTPENNVICIMPKQKVALDNE